MIENKVPIIVGPTAVGKTTIAIRFAEKMNAEIVSADSRQVYRYMDIGTAKPGKEELGIPHHFIDIRDPDCYYSAGEYGREARDCIQRLLKSVLPLVVGGSGFYIQALVDGLFAPRISNPEIKKKWHEKIANEGVKAVFDYLSRIDPVTAERLHPNDHQRVVRALEVYDITGIPISKFRDRKPDQAFFTPVFIGFTREREHLYQRIENRVDRMITNGLIDEVENLNKMGFSPDLNALKTVGYRETFSYLNREITYSEMISEIKKNTRRYAKRQLTWFKKDSRIHWINLDLFSQEETVRQMIEVYED